jgi:lysophospholipase L1-like esterase
MQAKNGSASPRRRRGGVIGCVLMLALAVSALALAPAAANAENAAPATSDYIALGDSISYGYSAERFNVHFPTESPTFFEEGVANDATKLLRKTLGKGLTLVNDACPGETSNGLIGENPVLGGEVSTETYEEVEGQPKERFPAGGYQGLGDWHPCKYTFRNHLPLHNGGYFEGTKEVSQLEEALATIKSVNPVTKEPTQVKAITLNIGNNDELAGIKQCEDEVIVEFTEHGSSKYGGATPPEAIFHCILNAAEHILVPHILKNIEQTLTVLEANYSGPIILLGFYNPDSFVLADSDILQKATNTAVEKELSKFPHTTYANPFPVFNKGAGKPIKEQEAICTYTEMCNPNVQVKGGKPEGDDGDIHPTIKGYKALAKLVVKAYEANPAK